MMPHYLVRLYIVIGTVMDAILNKRLTELKRASGRLQLIPSYDALVRLIKLLLARLNLCINFAFHLAPITSFYQSLMTHVGLVSLISPASASMTNNALGFSTYQS